MISREELNKIALNTGLNLYQQEKDYGLTLFLHYYYQKHQQALFKGGTCLRFLFGLNRFSEDLDFNIKNPISFKDEVKKTLQKIKGLGINTYFIKEEIFKDSYTCEIGFDGPLFTGNAQTRNKWRIDAGYRTGTMLKPEWRVFKNDYPELEQNFLVLTMNINEIFAEKIISLFQRKKGRDLYDLWFLMQANIQLDNKLLQKKLSQSKIKSDMNNMVGEDDYKRDMSKLTNRIIPYKQVKDEILLFLSKNKVI